MGYERTRASRDDPKLYLYTRVYLFIFEIYFIRTSRVNPFKAHIGYIFAMGTVI